MTAVDNLVTWLREQLADDWEDAAEALHRSAPLRSVHFEIGWGWSLDTIERATQQLTHKPVPGAPSPGRVLADIAAKRRILDECATQLPDEGTSGAILARRTVRLLALPYAGRDGYREEWRPAT